MSTFVKTQSTKVRETSRGTFMVERRVQFCDNGSCYEQMGDDHGMLAEFKTSAEAETAAAAWVL